MKTLLLLITFFAFLQSAFLGVNLVLVLIVARGLVVDDREALFLGFFGGLILGFLTQVNLGYYPLVFILTIKAAGVLKKLPVAFNLLTVLLFGAVLIILNAFLNSLFIGQMFDVYPHLIEIVLVLAFYFPVKFWEERFIVKKQAKLRI